MGNIIVGILLLLGTGFTLVASIGVVRLPDLWMRMHSSTKAGTLGAGLTVFGMAFHFGTLSIVSICLATVLFLVLTAPVAAHLIGRAGYLVEDVEIWDGTVLDEFQDEVEDQLKKKRKKG